MYTGCNMVLSHESCNFLYLVSGCYLCYLRLDHASFLGKSLPQMLNDISLLIVKALRDHLHALMCSVTVVFIPTMKDDQRLVHKGARHSIGFMLPIVCVPY